MAGNHALLSPSGASKWMNCPASLAAEIGIAANDSIYAQEGTAAHSVAEQVLRALNPSWKEKRPRFRRTTAAHFVGEVVEGWPISAEMAEPIQVYIDTVLAAAAGHTLHVEQRVDFSHIVGLTSSFGTADAIVIAGDELQVHDLKFGQGVKVDAENNPQLMIYALGALRMFEIGEEFKTVRLFIHQPRLNHVSEWALDVAELLEFGRRAGAAAAEAVRLYREAELFKLPPASAFNPGEKQCKWCKAAPTCRAYAMRVYDTVAADFVDLDAAEFETRNPAHMTPEQVAQAHRNIPLIEAWCDKLKKSVYQQLLGGAELPGLKLVAGRAGARKWANEQDAESLLLDLEESGDVYTRKLVSPTQAEKLFKHDDQAWERLQPLISRAAGSPVVVSSDDRRPALVLDAANDFDYVTGE